MWWAMTGLQLQLSDLFECYFHYCYSCHLLVTTLQPQGKTPFGDSHEFAHVHLQAFKVFFSCLHLLAKEVLPLGHNISAKFDELSAKIHEEPTDIHYTQQCAY